MKTDKLLAVLILCCLVLSLFLALRLNLTGFMIVENEARCGKLDRENSVYTLLKDIEFEGTCFYVLANNITINLNGFNLSGKGEERGYGIYVNGFNETSVINGRIRGFDTGIGFNNSFKARVENVITESNFDSGIVLLNSNNNLIDSSRSESNSFYGIKIERSNENFIRKSFFDYNFDTGIFVLDSFHNTFRDIGLNDNSWDGVHLYRCINNSFFETESRNNYWGGISLTASSLNIFEGLKIDSSLRGLYVSADSRANVFSDFVVYNCTSESGCLRISNSEGNVFSRGIVNLSKGYAVFIDSIISRSSSHNLFRDIVIENSIGASVYSRTLGPNSENIDNVFINSSYSHEILENVASGGENEIVRMWDVDFGVYDKNKTGISGAVVRVVNENGEIVVLDYTDSNGIAAKKELTQYVTNNEGISDLSRYEAYVRNKEGVTANKSISVLGNKVENIVF